MLENQRPVGTWPNLSRRCFSRSFFFEFYIFTGDEHHTTGTDALLPPPCHASPSAGGPTVRAMPPVALRTLCAHARAPATCKACTYLREKEAKARAKAADKVAKAADKAAKAAHKAARAAKKLSTDPWTGAEDAALGRLQACVLPCSPPCITHG